MLKFDKIDKGQQYYFSSAVKRGCDWFLIFPSSAKIRDLLFLTDRMHWIIFSDTKGHIRHVLKQLYSSIVLYLVVHI